MGEKIKYDHKLEVDVLIVGSGPVGCTFARKLVEAGRKVYMIDAGATLSDRPGSHLKNSFLYQRNVDPFSSVIRGHLHILSVSTNRQSVVTLDPAAFSFDLNQYKGFVINNQNPNQEDYDNLGMAAATYAVGGMATHWTCACPEQHPIERTDIISNNEWNVLYEEAKKLLNVSTKEYDNSIRHNVVLKALKDEYEELPEAYAPQSLPLAVERRQDNDELVTWSGSDTVLGEAMLKKDPLSKLPPEDEKEKDFVIKPQHRCKKIVRSKDGSRIEYAVVENLIEWKTIKVYAKTFIVAAGAVLTPQILYNSDIKRNVGNYLAEQPMAFCQVVLKKELVEGIKELYFSDKIKDLKRRCEAHQKKNPKDPVPIPMNDPEPQVWIPVSEERPWHCQIHRDAFSYGDLAPNVDSRLIVDLRWFGIVQQQKENRVEFSLDNLDIFGMPQPTFHFSVNDDDAKTHHTMMEDMLRAAGALGGFLPGSEPQFMIPGLTLHIHGTIRMGKDSNTSVVDEYLRVWEFNNLYLGGNGVLPVGNASNPTLTSVALAIRASNKIING
jgi:pyranose oxidase